MVTTSRFTVKVVDKNDNPIQNAKVDIDSFTVSETGYTGEDGKVRFNPTRGAYIDVEVSKSGYSDGYGGKLNSWGEQVETVQLTSDETDTIWQRFLQFLHTRISIGFIDTNIKYWHIILAFALFISLIILMLWYI